MTSFDNPEFNINNYPSAMTDSLGITLAPGWDVADDQYEFPANDTESECPRSWPTPGSSSRLAPTPAPRSGSVTGCSSSKRAPRR